LVGANLGAAVVVPEAEALTVRLALGDGAVRHRRVPVDGDGADEKDAADAGAAAGVKDGAGGLDDLGAEDAPGAVVAHARGAVVDDIGAADGAADRGLVAQVGADHLGAELVEEGGAARGSDQRPDALAALDELLSDVAAEQAGCTRQHVQLVRHRVPLPTLSPHRAGPAR
jgi:hypothetical protein